MRPPADLPFPTCHFFLGQIVRHRRYGYRGVIVSVDATCEADEQWYQHNRTQPDRDQPWYHVLVDGGDHTTYVAEENLATSDDVSRIRHRLVRRFFTLYANGRYYQGVSLN